MQFAMASALITEDRKSPGARARPILSRELWIAQSQSAVAAADFVRRCREERKSFRGYVESLRIKIPTPEETARNLSGGNQQKVVLATVAAGQQRIILFDEPTPRYRHRRKAGDLSVDQPPGRQQGKRS